MDGSKNREFVPATMLWTVDHPRPVVRPRTSGKTDEEAAVECLKKLGYTVIAPSGKKPRAT